MNKVLYALGVQILAAALWPGSSVAQQNEKPLAYTYATYMYCDIGPGKQERMDEIVAAVDQKVYNEAIEQGVIDGWGWLAHQTGGLWRRLLYFQTESLEGLWDAQESMAKRFPEVGGRETGAERFEICHAHEDYVWALRLSSSGDARSGTGFSVYYECDIARETRADEIMENDFARVYDKYVEQGKLASWSWSSHVIGGKYRRLHTMTADSRTALLNARSQIINELFRSGVDTGPEFSEICGRHTDYMWDIQLEFRKDQ
ncbi:MAG: hypothetical protein ACR2QU_09125 [Gammaproteobacteria bacterium]